MKVVHGGGLKKRSGILLFGATVLAGFCLFSANEVGAESQNVTMIGTSDVHGNLWDYSYEDGKPADLGLARVATVVKDARAQNGTGTVVIDNGDMMQGTILTDDIYNLGKGKNGTIHPMIYGMNLIGYDSMTLGNHEFNFGQDMIKQAQKDAKFPILSANTYYNEKAGAELSGKNFVGNVTVKTLDNGVKVGILGMTVPQIPLWDGPRVTDLTFNPLVSEAQKWVKVLKDEQKVDIVIASIHDGLDNTFKGAGARNVIEQVPEIDAFLIGHDHKTIAESIKDKNGKAKPVVAPKDTGSQICKIEFKMDKAADGSWTIAQADPSIIEAKTVAGDQDFKAATKKYHEEVESYISTPIGEASGDFLPKQEVPGIPEAQLQPTAMLSLIHNVQRKVTGAELSAAALFKESSNLPKGEITYANMFDLYKYPNTLVSVPITGEKLLAYMEKQAEYYQQTAPGDMTIAFSPGTRIYNYDTLSGVNYKIDISQPAGSRIKDASINGKAIDPKHEYSIAVNNYRYSGMVSSGYIDGSKPYLYNSDPTTLRTEIANYVEKQKVIDPEKEIERNWEIIGFDKSNEWRPLVISLLQAGVIKTEYSADGRTPNVKKININDLLKENKIPAGWATVNDGKDKMYVTKDIQLAKNWQNLDGQWYHFDQKGIMSKGWLDLGGTWYYLNQEGQMQTGWQNINNTWYYLGEANDGAMKTGWQKINNTWYYFDNSGAMKTGWQQVGASWYYLGEANDGSMKIGWQKVGNAWYYFDNSGSMATGWRKVGNTWYFMNPSGAMATGWLNLHGTWYLLDASGAMKTGWQLVGPTWYYFDNSGAMVNKTRSINGTTYRFDASGAWIG